MKPSFFLFLVFSLSGCSTLNWALFGQDQPSVFPKKGQPGPEKKISDQPHSFSEKRVKRTYFGYPILTLDLQGRLNDYDQGLTYALRRSVERNPAKRFRVVGWYKSRSGYVKGVVESLKKTLIKKGIPAQNILIRFEKASRNQKYDQVHLYER